MTPQPFTMRQLKALVTNAHGCKLRELQVLLSLVLHANDRDEAWPSNETIGKPWKLDVRHVRRAIADLQKATPDRPAMLTTADAGGGKTDAGRGRSARRRLAFCQLPTRAELALVDDVNTGAELAPVTRDNTGAELARAELALLGESTRANLDNIPGPNWPLIPGPIRPPEETNEQTIEENNTGLGDSPPVTSAPAKKRAPKASSSDPESVAIPLELNDPAFLPEWAAYLRHRREHKSKLTPTAAVMQLEKLKGWGVARSVIAIRHSVANGWQSIFEPNTPKGNYGNPKTKNIDAGRYKAPDRSFPGPENAPTGDGRSARGSTGSGNGAIPASRVA